MLRKSDLRFWSFCFSIIFLYGTVGAVPTRVGGSNAWRSEKSAWVHGLWPQGQHGRRQRGGCGSQKPVPTVNDSCQRADEGALASGRLRACGTCSDCCRFGPFGCIFGSENGLKLEAPNILTLISSLLSLLWWLLHFHTPSLSSVAPTSVLPRVHLLLAPGLLLLSHWVLHGTALSHFFLQCHASLIAMPEGGWEKENRMSELCTEAVWTGRKTSEPWLEELVC